MSTRPQTRREFLQSAARVSLLGAVGLIAAVLFRRGCAAPAGCAGCAGCATSDRCALPWKEKKR